MLPSRLHLDLETFAESRDTSESQAGRVVDGVDRVKDGVCNYAKHLATGVYMAGIKWTGMPKALVAIFWEIREGPAGKYPRRKTEAELFAQYPFLPIFLRALATGAIVVAHNAAFERWVWNEIVVGRYYPNWPKIQLERQDCTMARANAMSLPAGLGNLARVLRLKHQKHDSVLMKLMAKSSPWHIAVVTNETLAELATYCAGDVECEAEADEVLYKLTPFQQELWRLDQEINDRGIPVNVPAIRKALKIVEVSKDLANARLKELTGGAVKTAQQAGAMLAWLQAQGHATLFSVSAFALKTYEEDYGWGSPLIEEALELRECASRASVAKLQAILDLLRLSPDGRVRHQYVLWGAGPGRWTGRGFQPQNIKRFDDDTQPLADVLMAELGNPELDAMLESQDPAVRWALAKRAAVRIQDATGQNPIIVIGKCMRVLIKAPGLEG